MLAGDAVQPPFDSTGQQEVVLVDAEDAAFLENALVEPFGDGDRHGDRVAIGRFLGSPGIDPAEAAPLGSAVRWADISFDVGCAQPAQGVQQLPVLVAAMLPADALQQLIGVEVDGTAGLLFPINSLGDLGSRPDQDVRVPDGGDAVFAGRHLHRNAIDAVLDRGAAWVLRQTEKWPLHRVTLIADRYIGIGSPEDIKLDWLVSH